MMKILCRQDGDKGLGRSLYEYLYKSPESNQKGIKKNLKCGYNYQMVS